MPRLPQNMTPPRTRPQPLGGASAGAPPPGGTGGSSPALVMARRIRTEQGQEQAKRYLFAMEPYLAPAERAYIAEQLDLTLTEAERAAFSVERQAAFAQPRQTAQQAGSAPFGMPFAQQGGGGGASFAQQQGNPTQGMQGLGSMMPLLQMLGSMQGGGQMGGMPGGLGGMLGGMAGLPGGLGGMLGGMPGGQQGGMNDQMMLMQTLMGLMGKK